MAFEIASTNLLLELGLILTFVMGWQFTLAEFVGGPLIIVFVALGFRVWMRGKNCGDRPDPSREGRGWLHRGPRSDGHVHHCRR
ncbi:permease [Arthrobacter alpinus]|uniref:permease n=2 Tax=Arthrobacter TaxID=1663 RepID=UPI0018D01C37